ncbi:MAG: M20 family peptidase [Bacillota bacterium]|nr:M20 family peptidase [Bacillota bacterium]
MKQEISNYIDSIKNEVFQLSEYLYHNPEPSFHEYKAYNYLINLLKMHNFDIKENYLNMSTSFYGKFGEGHPKICFLCEYDASPQGHIEGHNLVSAISIASALSLSKIISKLGGSVIVIGCPGELVGGSKLTLVKQGVFDDIDTVLMAHPYTINSQSGTSSAVIPMAIKYGQMDNKDNHLGKIYNLTDLCLLTLNTIQMLVKGFGENHSLTGLKITGEKDSPTNSPEIESCFYINTPKMHTAEYIESKVREFCETTKNIFNVASQVHIFDLPCSELITSQTLSRLFCHNLKECGIIHIEAPIKLKERPSIGNISQFVPCIHPFISIVEENNIKFKTTKFADATISQYAQEVVVKTAKALAFTALDLIEKDILLREAKTELFYTVNNTN